MCETDDYAGNTTGRESRQICLNEEKWNKKEL